MHHFSAHTLTLNCVSQFRYSNITIRSAALLRLSCFLIDQGEDYKTTVILPCTTSAPIFLFLMRECYWSSKHCGGYWRNISDRESLRVSWNCWLHFGWWRWCMISTNEWWWWFWCCVQCPRRCHCRLLLFHLGSLIAQGRPRYRMYVRNHAWPYKFVNIL